MTGTVARDAAWRRRYLHASTMVRLAGPYAALGVLKHAVPLPRLARWAWLRPAGPRNAVAEALMLRSLVRLRRLTLGDRGDCVQGSLVLYRALSRAGADPRLMVGFRRERGRLRGHAWVEVDGQAVAERAPIHERFTPAFAFGADGVPIVLPPPSERVSA
jgi:hypothetical protein